MSIKYILITFNGSSFRGAENYSSSLAIRAIKDLFNAITSIIYLTISIVVKRSIFASIEMRANRSARAISFDSVVGIQRIENDFSYFDSVNFNAVNLANKSFLFRGFDGNF